MSDDEADPELLELLRQSLGLGERPQNDEVGYDTGVLQDAEFVYANAIDVSIDMNGTRAAAAAINKSMHERRYSFEAWSQVELHPKRRDGFSELDIVNFVFTLDLLNFSFWSERFETKRFQVEYRGQRWMGYNSLLACLRRALDDGIPLTTPAYWNRPECTDDMMRHVFRSATDEEMPLLDERVQILREAGKIMHESFDDALSPSLDTPAASALATDDERDVRLVHEVAVPDTSQMGSAQEDRPDQIATNEVHNGTSTDPRTEHNHTTRLVTETNLLALPLGEDRSAVRLIEKASGSAGKLVNLLAKNLPSFRDESHFEGRRVRFLKRAQIMVADLWAALGGQGYGAFDDMDRLTMFADYRVPQILQSLGVLVYSPPLEKAMRCHQVIPHGHSWEIQLRGCSIWAVELMRREMRRQTPETTSDTAALIDFFLYDLAKEREAAGKLRLPHHRTRSIWY